MNALQHTDLARDSSKLSKLKLFLNYLYMWSIKDQCKAEKAI